MPLRGSHPVLGLAKTFRIIWLGGNYGSGKTALSYRLGIDLVLSGAFEHIVSNIPAVVNTPISQVKLDSSLRVNSVVILDEGGLFLKKNSDAERFLAFLRKLNICLIVPSVQSVPADLRGVRIRRVFDWTSVGVPIWTYRYTQRDTEFSETGVFHWFNPAEIFGVYDTNSFPTDADNIEGWLVETTNTAKNETTNQVLEKEARSLFGLLPDDSPVHAEQYAIESRSNVGQVEESNNSDIVSAVEELAYSSELALSVYHQERKKSKNRR